MMSYLTVENLSFSYENNYLIDQISFSINPQEIVSLLGRSGCGKTTLFRLLAGLSQPHSGYLKVNCKLSYMTQNTLLLPWRSVLGNLMLPYELGSKTTYCLESLKERALYFLDQVGLMDVADKYPHEISGGMKSRVSLARALFEDTNLLLLDEPFAFLDAITRKECQKLLADLKQKFDKSIVLVTHDIEEAVFLSDRILLLSNGKIKKSWNDIGIISDKADFANHIQSFL
jgi:putative hydroxymethylpyrimidine transport system ATP-binding protein